MAKDLRMYLEYLEKEKPETVLRVKKPMKVAYEISALQRKLDALKKYPVMIIERPILDNGEESAFPVVTNLTASRELCAEAMGLDGEQRRCSGKRGDRAWR